MKDVTEDEGESWESPKPSTSSSSSSHKKRKPTKGSDVSDPPHKYDEAFRKLNKLEEDIRKRDENDAFGDYVAEELKKFAPLERCLLKRDISNLISNYMLQTLAKNDSVIVLEQTDDN